MRIHSLERISGELSLNLLNFFEECFDGAFEKSECLEMHWDHNSGMPQEPAHSISSLSGAHGEMVPYRKQQMCRLVQIIDDLHVRHYISVSSMVYGEVMGLQDVASRLTASHNRAIRSTAARTVVCRDHLHAAEAKVNATAFIHAAALVLRKVEVLLVETADLIVANYFGVWLLGVLDDIRGTVGVIKVPMSHQHKISIIRHGCFQVLRQFGVAKPGVEVYYSRN